MSVRSAIAQSHDNFNDGLKLNYRLSESSGLTVTEPDSDPPVPASSPACPEKESLGEAPHVVKPPVMWRPPKEVLWFGGPEIRGIAEAAALEYAEPPTGHPFNA